MRRIFLICGVVILLVAAGLRLRQLADYPPGPHYDEAVNLIITRTVAFGGARPFPIIEAYQGREVLYYYIAAPLLSLLGDDIFTLQLTSAWLNLLAIAASMVLGRAMFPGWRGLIVGLVVGVAMTISFPQIFLARQAFRAVTLPFCQAFALLFLWRGLNARRGNWRWLTTGGVFAGLALYTYMASRLFPLWLLLAGVTLLWAARGERLRRLRQGMIFFAVFGMVAAPVILFAAQKPDIFLGRLGEVTAADDAITFGESILIHARMFFNRGEAYLRYNIPGRPYLTGIEGVFLLIGMVMAGWRILRPGRPTERAACALALLSPLMVLPSVISVGGLPPNHMRSVAMTPLIFVLVGMGVEAAWSWLTKFAETLQNLSVTPAQRVWPIGMTAVIAVLLGGFGVHQEYFMWAGRADLYYETDTDLTAAAEWLPAQFDEVDEGDGTIVYVAARDRGHPTVLIHDVPPVTWLGTDSLFLPPPGRDALYIFPRSAPPTADWLDLLEPGRIEDLPLAPDNRTAFEAFRLAPETLVRAAAYNPQRDAPQNGFLTWSGTQAAPIPAGSRADVMLIWRIDQTPAAGDLRPLAQLEDSLGNVLHRADVYLTESDRWRAGEILLQGVEIAVPDFTPPGTYPLRVAWAERNRDVYLPYEGGQVWADAGSITVPRPDMFPEDAPVDVRREIVFAPGVELLGWNQFPQQRRPGETLPVTLFWRALDADRPAFELEVALRGADETVIWAGEPIRDTYPADEWQPGELLADRARWTIPREQAAGNYEVMLRSDDTEVTLGQIQIEGLPRQFEPPAAQEVIEATLGDALQLYGYTLTLDEDQSAFSLELIWYAAATVEQDYTVFVHLVDETGALLAQRDVSPQDGTYPTSLWAEGEYIIDIHTFMQIPDGDYSLRVGLYSQITGDRLQVRTSNNLLRNDYIEIPGRKVYN
jgi:4-amino-4-deoxy-L-arabinose transferase-like glycosyltransferase